MKTNFKASKTVLALAVAGLISCGAFAADTETELKTDWTITADESGTLSKDTDVTNLTVEKEGSLTGTDKCSGHSRFEQQCGYHQHRFW